MTDKWLQKLVGVEAVLFVAIGIAGAGHLIIGIPAYLVAAKLLWILTLSVLMFGIAVIGINSIPVEASLLRRLFGNVFFLGMVIVVTSVAIMMLFGED